LAKLDVIDKKLEEKLAELEYTFGRKGKALEEEIRDLAEERNELTETKRRPLFRKVVSHLLDYRIAC
jgi:small subunit ribosomal protein S5